MTQYYYLNAQNAPQGPHSLDELANLMASGRINPTTLVACKGGASWEPLGSILSRENIQASPTNIEPGKVGNCPRCGHDLSDSLSAGTLPPRCPRCMRNFHAERPGIWQNFCLAIRNYAEFSGRATRAEFWSLQLITILGYVAIIILAAAGMFSFISIAQESGGAEALIEALEHEDDVETYQALSSVGGEAALGFTLLMASILLIFGWFFFTLIPCISATFRRLHDIGRSAWWFGAYLIASFAQGVITTPLKSSGSELLNALGMLIDALMFGYYILLIVFCIMDSQRGSNAYGPSSKYPQG